MGRRVNSTATARGSSFERERAELAARLQARREEIERAMLTRIHAVAGGAQTTDTEYLDGLRSTPAVALDYAFLALEVGDQHLRPLPTALLSQARLAARNRVSIDTVLRRYFASYTLFCDFVLEEAEAAAPLRGVSLRRLVQSHAAQFDQLVAAVTEEYMREAARRPSSAEERRAERVRRLLAGEFLDTTELNYDFDGWHLGAIVVGEGAGEAVRDLAKELGQRLLVAPQGALSVWAWLGSRRGVDPTELESRVSVDWPPGLKIAIGDPGKGISGWRLTHRQASAALQIALRTSTNTTRHRDVALVASMIRDDVLVTSLRQSYLAPLQEERGMGETAISTLHAYFEADRSVSSAAATLGVKRHTVTRRLRGIERRLGRPLRSCAAEIEAALRLERINEAMDSNPATLH